MTVSMKQERSEKNVGNIRRALRRPSYPAQHCARTIAFIVRTFERPDELMERLRETLGTDRIIGAWCETAARDVVAFVGEIDPLVSRVREAYAAEAGQRRNPDNVSKPQRWRTVGTVKNNESGAPVQVFRKARTKWQPPEQPNRPKR